MWWYYENPLNIEATVDGNIDSGIVTTALIVLPSASSSGKFSGELCSGVQAPGDKHFGALFFLPIYYINKVRAVKN